MAKKNYKWKYDNKLYETKREALKEVGTKEHWSSPAKYFWAKRSIHKVYFNVQ